MKAGSPSNGHFLTSPCPPRPKNQSFTKGIVFFYNRNFCSVKKRVKKHEKTGKMEQTKKQSKNRKFEKHENMKALKMSKVFWLHTQNPRRFPGFVVVVVTFFFEEIFDDFQHFSECGRETKTLISPKQIDEHFLSASNNNYSFRATDHSTTTNDSADPLDAVVGAQ